MGNDEAASGHHFIKAKIDADLAAGRYQGRVVTRFPPEPNGYLHIGHAKSICLNFGLARDYDGVCHLRYDDTNPTTEDPEYVDAILRDVRWLGFDPAEKVFYASDYYEQLYQWAEQLVRDGKAYVCPLSEEEIRVWRGTVTEAGRPSPGRERSVDENLDLLRRMRAGEFPNGTCTLRARIDMASPNMKMRDPLIYRIKHAHHYRTGDAWCIYPMYDYAHCLSDAIEGITHSICTLEFENNRELYDWFIQAVGFEDPPEQTEFARLALTHVMTSKRRLLQLVRDGHVAGWDDPRMPTIAGLRRRGVPAAALRAFAERVGIAKANSTVDYALLEHTIRDVLNDEAPRVMAVLRPLAVEIVNLPDDHLEWRDVPYYPHDVPREGSRRVPFTKHLFIERSDFEEEPPEGFHRLVPGGEVRLRYAYVLRCEEVVREGGEVVGIRCRVDLDSAGGRTADGRKVKGVIHWVSAERSLEAEVRLYDHLLPEAYDPEADLVSQLVPGSLEVIAGARVEASLGEDGEVPRYQFERNGYFARDLDSSPGALVFNRIVALRDSWTRQAAPRTEAPVKVESAPKVRSEPTREAWRPSADEAEAFARYTGLGLSEDDARVLTVEADYGAFFDAALLEHGNASGIANVLLNTLRAELKGSALAELRFGPAALAHLVALIDEGTLSTKLARQVLAELLAEGGDPRAIVEAKGLVKITDPATLGAAIDAVFAANPAEAERFRAGERQLQGFLIGLLMRQTGGKADPKVAAKLLAARAG